jgi:hypothetical protein
VDHYHQRSPSTLRRTTRRTTTKPEEVDDPATMTLPENLPHSARDEIRQKRLLRAMKVKKVSQGGKALAVPPVRMR